MSKYTPATFQPTVRPDWAGILSYLSDKEKSDILVALFKYPSVECDSAFWKETIKPDLDLQYEIFTESCKAKSRGVRNRWDKISITDVEDMKKISIREHIDTEREREKEKKSIEEHSSRIWNTKKQFIPPTLQEVLDFAKQQNDMAGTLGFSCPRKIAEEFWAHYDSQGWVKSNDSRTPITNWQSSLRSWALNPNKFSKVGNAAPADYDLPL